MFASSFVQLLWTSLRITTSCGIPISRIRHIDVTHTLEGPTGKKSVRRESRPLRRFIRKPHENSGANVKRFRRCLRVLKIVLSRGRRPSYLLERSPTKEVRHLRCGLSGGKLPSAKHSTFKMILNPSELRQESLISIFLSWSLQTLTDRTLYKI